MDSYHRREFIKTSVPSFLGLILALPAVNALATKANAYQGRVPSNASINWDAYLSELHRIVAKQHLDHWTEEAYLKEVVQLAKRLNLNDPVLKAGFKKGLQGAKNGRIDFTDLEKNENFAVCLLDFQQGEKIRAHDHPGMTGVIQCASGAIQIENYDFLQKRLGRDSVLLHHSASSSMKKGTISSLTSRARNIHALEAQSPTQLVDIFSPPYDRQRAVKSSWYTIDEESFNGHRGIYEAEVRS